MNTLLATHQWYISVPVFATTILSFVAASVLWATSSVVDDGLRRAFRIASVLAGVYFASYVWLLFHPHMSGEWSRTMRWVGPVSWGLVWIWMPLAVVRHNRKKAEVFIREANRVVDEYGVTEEEDIRQG